MDNHARVLLSYGETIPRHLITQSLAWILLKDARHLYLVDGVNALAADGLVRFIARQGQDPSAALIRIHVIIVTKLPPVKTAARAVMARRVKEHADGVYHIGNGE